MRRILWFSLSFFILSVVLLLSWWFRFLTEPASHLTNSEVEFKVSKGETVKSVARRLEKERLISSAILFVILTKHRELGQSIKSGGFMIPTHARPDDILEILVAAPPSKERMYIFPEGLNKWQLADRMASYGWSRETTLSLIQEQRWEGRLFPDSYRFSPTDTEKSILTRMHHRFEQVWSALIAQKSEKNQLTELELLTLASLVEKETVSGEEAPIIARVFINRLERGMKLQSDPTYMYTAKRYGKKPTKADRLRKGNPYNTDQIKGLPPGPIANPGRVAMLAALKPSVDNRAREWLFFVAKRDGSGRHYFSKTYDEHKRAIRKYLRKK